MISLNKLLFIPLIVFVTEFSLSQDTLTTSIRDSIVQTAISQLGVKYKWATSEENVSFDCSGFTSYVYRKNHINAPRVSREYATIGQEINLEGCQKGDCIIFTAPKSNTPGHIGIIIENNENGIKFIHCSSSKKHFGVVITDYYSSGYPKRFLSVRRLF